MKPEDIERILSTERFARYLAWADGQHPEAVRLYKLNCAVSEAFYTPLHLVELTLRNRMDAVLTKQYGRLWWDAPQWPLQNRGLKAKIDEAKSMLTRDKKAVTHGSVVALLSFGFWVGLVGPGRPRDELWKRCLNQIALRPDGKGLTRDAFSKPLQKLRRLRNRIAHHEPVLHLDLPRHHALARDLCMWMSPAAGHWLDEESRFSEIWPKDGVTLKS